MPAKTRKKTKSTKKAPQKQRRRPQCATKGCRRVARDAGYCTQCLGRNPTHVTTKTSELRAARWGSLDLELRNAVQGIALLKKDMTIAQQQYDQAQRLRQAKIEELQTRHDQTRQHYEHLTAEIAADVGLEGKAITIDPDTGVVRELKNEG
jgi:hypothetical protein